jgi:imidazolonepropionase-like amidohydrolase
MINCAFVPVLSLIALAVAQGQQRPVAFVNVTVVPMSRDGLLEHQTVVVQDGRVKVAGPQRTVRVPKGAAMIDGEGKFLMPGLADMHVHFVRPLPTTSQTYAKSASGREPGIPASASGDHERENQAYALLFVANGVTTVRNMWGSETIDAFAQDINSARAIGPFVYSTGPITDGNPPSWASTRIVETPGQAEEAVTADKLKNYVAIKVYSGLSRDAYGSIVAAARRHGLPVVGHVPVSVGLEGVIAAHQDSVEHLDGFVPALQPEGSQAPGRSGADRIRMADLRRLPALVQTIREAGISICPTVVSYNPARTDAVGLEQAGFVPPAVFERYRIMYPNAAANVDPRSTPQAHALWIAIVRGLHEGGAHLLLGTDTVKLGALPGYSLHEELENFVAAGMTPYQALRAGTADAAKFLGQEKEFGVIEAGRRDDLLLLTANPLADVKNTTKMAGVMAGGRWFTAADLGQKLADLRATYHR